MQRACGAHLVRARTGHTRVDNSLIVYELGVGPQEFDRLLVAVREAVRCFGLNRLIEPQANNVS